MRPTSAHSTSLAPLSKRRILGLLALIALGAALRAPFLASRSMQYDEAFTFNEYATKPWGEGISLYTFPNNHLFHTLLAHISIALFGVQPWAVRLPAFLAGLALIPATHAAVRRLGDERSAMLAAGLVASSSTLINYSTNARGYSLLCLFTVLLVGLAAKLRDGGRFRDWAWLTILPALGFFTIPVMVLPYGGVLLWAVGSSLIGGKKFRIDALVVSCILCAFLTMILHLPVVAKSGLRSLTSNSFVSPRPLEEVARGLPEALAGAWIQWSFDVPRVVAIGFLVCAILSWRSRPTSPFKLLLTVVVWGLAVSVQRRVVPYERVWIFLAPIYEMCVASGLLGIVDRFAPRARRGVVATLPIVLGLLVAFGDEIPKETRRLTLNHADEFVGLLKVELRPDDAVAAYLPCDAPLKYYFLINGLAPEPLYDYRVMRASRLFVAVDRRCEQTLDSVLRDARIPRDRFAAPRMLSDRGDSALYVLDRATSNPSASR